MVLAIDLCLKSFRFQMYKSNSAKVEYLKEWKLESILKCWQILNWKPFLFAYIGHLHIIAMM